MIPKYHLGGQQNSWYYEKFMKQLIRNCMEVYNKMSTVPGSLLLCENKPNMCICRYVNLLHYKSCEPYAYIGRLLWPSSGKYFKKDVTKTSKPIHKYKMLHFKYVV